MNLTTGRRPLLFLLVIPMLGLAASAQAQPPGPTIDSIGQGSNLAEVHLTWSWSLGNSACNPVDRWFVDYRKIGQPWRTFVADDPNNATSGSYEIREDLGTSVSSKSFTIGPSATGHNAGEIGVTLDDVAYEVRVAVYSPTCEDSNPYGDSLTARTKNTLPGVTNPVPDQSVVEGETVDVDVSSVFTDVDGDPLTLTAASDAAAVATVTVSGTTLTVAGVTAGTATATLTADDGQGGTVDDTFTVTVEADESPSFGSETITAQVYTEGVAITALTLPEATGGNGTLTYSIAETLPAGLTFTGSSRELSGTPTTIQTATDYTYTVTDGDGDTATLTLSITVEDDVSPSFGSSTIPAQVYTEGVAITALTLPEATGGNGTLTYTIAEALPAGLSFTGSSRELSGTPTTVQTATDYTYTVTDAEGDTATLILSITVEDDVSPSFGSSTIPAQVYTEGVAITALTLPEATGGNGTLTYTIAETLPVGLTFTGSSRELSGTPTTVQTATDYTYTVTDADGDAATLTLSITVEDDLSPSFGSNTIAAQIYTKDVAITALTLPEATGGNGTLTYTIAETLPVGLTFTGSSRELSGTPTTVQPATDYTYTVTDADGDAATLTLSITVEADATPTFGSNTIPAQVYTKDVAITALTLPEATGGNGTLTYTIAEALPAGLTFTGSSRELSGTPTTVQTATDYTYTVTDADGDTATLTLSITVEDDVSPSFGSATIPAQIYTEGVAITALTLPEATGGNGTLTYTIAETLPAGLTFTGSSRELSGTPTTVQTATDYTYTVTDADGDTATLTLSITVEADATPTFGSNTIPAQVYTKDVAITALTLPEATGGNGTLTYTIAETLPAGLTFTGSSRELSGTPTTVQTATDYTYTVTDADGDSATLNLSITVEDDVSPSFGSATIPAQVYTKDVAITALTLPEATGGNGTLTYTIAETLPVGLTFTGASRQLSGTPTTVQTATDYTYTVTDADGDTATLTLSITVEDDVSPSFGSSTIPAQVYTEGVAITALTLPEATGGNGTLTYSIAETLPAGLTFTGASRELSGTPTTVQTATDYTYTVTDAEGDTATLILSITVEADATPSFGSSTIPAQVYTEGVAITALTLPEATGGNGTLTYTIAETLPAGLTFTGSSRELSGTPTTVQTATDYTYTVTDADGDAATLTLSITVEADATPSFGTATIPAQVYTYDVAITALTLPEATGGNGTLTYSFAGKLPPGLTFTGSNRQLSGTPTAVVGAADYTYMVTDADGDTATLTLSITVEDNVSPSFVSSTIPAQVYTQGVAITALTLPEAKGGNGTLTYTIAEALPAGLTFTGSSRQLAGTPTTVQTATDYTYTVTDADGDAATLTLSITVEADASPSFGSSTIPAQVYTEGVAITALTLPEATGGNGTLTYTIAEALPAGLTFTGSNRQLTGTPTTVQTATDYTYTVTDADGDAETLTLSITVEADASPSFGSATIPAQVYTHRVTITALTLPEATGGNGTLTYTIAEALPGGLTFTGSSRQLSGQPRAVQTATDYTYTVTDADGDTATLTLSITVEADATPSFGSSTIAPQVYTKDVAITTLTLPEATGGNGALTYTIAEALPAGLSFTGSSRQLTGTPTTVQTATDYTYTVTDADGDSATLNLSITVEDNVSPSFGSATIAAQVYTKDVAITALTLPEATGGNGTLTYTIAETLPVGLTFTGASRQLSGTPTTVQTATDYTYTVTDADGDTATLILSITVEADATPTFGSSTIAAQVYTKDVAITALTLPEATGGNGTLTYTIAEALPAGLTFTGASRELSGTPTTVQTATDYTYTVTDAEGDTATLILSITVEDDVSPSFGSSTIPAQVYTKDVPITALTLPEATGGNGTLTYSIAEALPAGLTFTGSSRELSGTPTTVQTATDYTYTVTDADGDTETLTLSITVEADATPSFGSATIPAQVYTYDVAITALTLPEATGGNGTLTYTIAETLPVGLTFTGSSRELSGTPSTVQTATDYTYTVTDADGDTATLTLSITVEADATPSFGSATIPAQVYTYDVAITALTLPEATGGNGTLTYSFAGKLPPGLTFTGSNRQLSGTPTAVVGAADYTYMVTDADGDTATLTLSITVEDNVSPSFVSSTIPAQVYTQGVAITALTLPEAKGGNGTLTYSFAEALPAGLTFTGSSRQLAGTPTTVQTATDYTYTVTDADGDAATLTLSITVEADASPSFGSSTIPAQVYTEGVAITALTLPEATGGNGTLTYSFAEALPAGLTFTGSSRELSGTPTTVQTATDYTYTVTDADGDTATLTLSITVEADATPSFGSATIPAQVYTYDVAITALTLPEATGGNGTLTYSFAGKLPPGLTFTGSNRQLSGTPTAVVGAADYTYMVTDADGDTATLTLSITVEDNVSPSFGSSTIPAQVYTQGVAITALTLPEAKGGNGTLTYSIVETLPAGLTFTGSSRQLAGTPTAVQTATDYTYTVTDADGDAATLTLSITVEADASPSFGSSTIPAQVYTEGVAITALTLPEATGGNGALTYTIAEALPAGLTFTGSSRELSGTPSTVQTATDYTYTVTDADGDTETLTLSITVEADATPSFGSATIPAQVYTHRVTITTLTLPEATGGNGTLTYTIAEALPGGLAFTGASRQLSGQPRAVQAATDYTYTVTDADGDTATLTLSITVEADATPSFGSATIPAQVFTKDVAITALTLPEATGGNGTLTYTIAEALPAGLTFTRSSRQLTGTPTTVQTATDYTYTVTDADGDAATLTLSITVEDDVSPSFGSATIPAQVYTKDVAITALTLPEATGGNGTLTYSIAEALPAGLSFTGASRQLSGTPTTVQTATDYTYTVTDADGDTATLTLSITVEDDVSPSFGSSTIAAQVYTKDVAITALTLPEATGGNGTLTYTIAETLPVGLTFTGASRQLSGTPTTVQTATDYTYTVTDADGDAATLTLSITVEDNVSPSFESATIAAQVYTKDVAIAALTLPEATGGNGTLTYSFAEALPAGLTFTGSSRELSGTPTTVQTATDYTYTVTDADGDTATLTLSITVEADASPSFGSSTITAQVYTQEVAITALTLPEATGGNGTLSYSITEALPAGLTFTASNRQLAGTPTAVQTATDYTYTVTDADGDTATLTLSITVEADASPSFGSSTITAQVYTQDVAITALTLPEATGGNGTLAYSIAEALPAGLTFNASSRELSGTPTTVQTAADYTYTVTDADGDAATLTLSITVEADASPSFGSSTITAQVYTQDVAITALTLPEATGGNGTLSYSIAEALPAGLTFTGSNRQLAGTPTAVQGATNYTYTVTDADGDTATLTLSITVEADASPSFGSSTITAQVYTQDVAITALTLPEATGGNGTLSYSIAEALPAGLTFTASNRQLAGTPTAVQTATDYTYTVTDADGDTATLTLSITVEADASPSFGSSTIPVQVYTQGVAITALTLPEATGGNGTLSYSITEALPAGLTFTASNRQLAGTPTAVQTATDYTYTVTDDDGDTATLTLSITVEADATPSFGSSTITAQVYTQDVAIPALTLPEATGGNGTLSYSITEALPAGLTFTASNRQLAGTPTAVQTATDYTYTVTDDDGDTATLTLSITVEADASPSFGSSTITAQVYTQDVAIPALTLPEATGGNGTLTYSIAEALPAGLTFTASNRQLAGTPTAVQTATDYTYTVTDDDGDTATLTLSITVEADASPSFGSSTIPAQVYTQGVAITALTLPEATGGNGTLTYSITEALPAGLTFTESNRQLAGTPTAVQGATNYTYTVTDADGDTATLTLSITVEADASPSFGSSTITAQVYTQDVAITALTLPEATGGNGTLSYSIAEALPAGLTFTASNRQLAGTPTAVQTATDYTYTVTDADGDTATLTLSITVEADASPSFGSSTITAQVYTQDVAITALTLPEATGGNGTLSYSIAEALPAGLTFTASNRQLAGTPTAVQTATDYTYTVTDADGDTATLTLSITVEADASPSFGSSTITAQVYTQDVGITALTLPEATGGNGTLSYSIAEALPAGLTFTASNRQLAGTPTAVQTATDYTYTVTDDDGDTATLTLSITVEADASPSFGSSTIPAQVYTQGVAITALTLPEATGGNGTLTYSITEALPAGLTFTESNRQLAGTPTAVQGATNYTYTVTDDDGDTATLTLSITVEADASPSFGSSTIPAQVYTQGVAITALTLPEATGGNGTLTYSITEALPAGLTFTASSRELAGTPTAVQGATNYTYTVTDADGDTATLTLSITVEADASPSFGSSTIPAQVYTQGVAITALTLPEATGGNGNLSYSFEEALPAGLTFTESSRELAGTPTAVQGATNYTYTVTDADGDTATLTLSITVEADASPSFGSSTIPAQVYTQGVAITALTLPEATGGNGNLSYSFEEALPAGLTFTESSRELAGTPTAVQGATNYTYTVTDADGDTATLTLSITVEADASPSFGSSTIPAQVYTQGVAITALTLPEATGGNGNLSYSFEEALPAGLTFTESSRQLAGTPTAVQGATNYTYTVTDADGDTATLTLSITVEADASPSFGSSTIPAQVYTQGVAITALTLPEATGGNGNLSYSFEEALPAGLTFTESSRQLAGTPTAVQGATNYTYTVTDADGDTATLTLSITVEADASPSFGSATIAAQVYTQGVAITALTLPEATGGNGNLTYSFEEALPAGLTFTESNRQLAGTPTAVQGATNYTYTVTDADGDTATLTLSITVEADASPSFGSSTIPAQVYTQGVAITALTLPEATGGNGNLTYSFEEALPAGLTFTESSRQLAGTPTAVQGATNYTYTVTDADGDTATLTLSITVEADASPSFGSSTIPAQVYTQGVAITALTLPEATGGNGNLSYSFEEALPAGLTFTESSRQLAGTPTAVQGATNYTYTVTDADGDTATLTLSITVEADASPSFGSSTIPAQVYTQGVAITALTLPEATGGNGNLSYSFEEALPAGLTFTESSRQLAGTPTAVQGATNYTYTVTDADGDTATLTLSITVEADASPSFGSSTVPAQVYTQGVAITALTLPEATGGNGNLSYSFEEALPAGLTFTESSRQLAGTPTAVQGATNYTYTVTDADGDTATLTLSITVEADASPNFGSATIVAQVYTQDVAITALTLPEATGGNGNLTYSFEEALPAGLTFTPSSRQLAGTPTSVQTATDYTYTVTDDDGDTATLTLSITVEADASPNFGSATIAAQVYTQDVAITALTLPEATGGNGNLTYSFEEALPAGLTFTPSSRQLAGTPTSVQTATDYTYTVTDDDGDTATLTLSITVEADASPNFGSATIAAQVYTQDVAITALTLPEATGGNGNLTYSFEEALPAGLTFTPSSRQLAGTPTAVQTATDYTYTVTDDDGDTATLTLSITVEADASPNFGSATIAAQVYTQDVAITALTLPEATGGNGNLTYSFEEALPAGLTFTPSSRQLAGTPTAVQTATDYTYTVTDDDGDTATLTLSITVEADASPSFGSATIAAQVYTQDVAITALTLPEATGGNGNLTYSFEEALPAGLTFTESSRQLAGTPTSVQTATDYTYTVTDDDGDTATLTLSITVEADASPNFGSATIAAQVYTQDVAITALTLPEATGGNGNLTYSFEEALPAGLTFTESSRQLAGTPTAVQGATNYTYTVTDADGDTATLTLSITVEADASPNFGSATIAAQVYTERVAITALTLPEATGGNGNLTYSFEEALPAGLTFTPSSRQLAGTPTAVQTATDYTYTVTDDDGDTATLTLSITVEADASPSFGSATIAAQVYAKDVGITALTLPEATGGNGALTYSIAETLPAGLTFTGSSRQLSGTPTTVQTATNYTYTVTDGDGDTATLTLSITVEDDLSPSFGSATIAAQVYTKDVAITTLTLPEATGGNGTLTYGFAETLPVGLTFTGSNRQLAGTPTAVQTATNYTYTVTDGDGDTATLTLSITVQGDIAPSFGSATIPAQVYTKDAAITALTLPAATGGNGNLTYSIAETLPDGLTFTASNRQLSGAPTTVQTATNYTYTVTDGDGDTATLTLSITVEDDLSPSFGNATIPAQVYTKDVSIAALTLPEATGGNGTLTYSIAETLPDGLTFTRSSRQLAGTPTTVQTATDYTYTVTDDDGDTATLTLSITVEAVATPSFGSRTIPAQVYTKDIAITTLTLPEATGGNGTLTYSIAEALPAGLTFTASNRQLSGTPTVVQTATDYTYTVTDRDGDTATLTLSITVEDDATPSFGSTTTILAQVYTKDMAITALSLPEATGGNGTLTYSIAEALPAGLTFTASNRQLSGTPTVVQTATDYTYTVTDRDGDTATLTLSITVEDDATPSFGSTTTILAQAYTKDVAITALTLPEATGGNGTLSYSIAEALPAGLTFTASNRQLSGTPTAVQTATDYTYTVTDRDGDTATLTLSITVEDDATPSFGSTTIPAQVYTKDAAITTLTLPEATGGNGGLSYSIAEALPAGLTFTPSSRQLSGTPAAVQTATDYTYTVTDRDGDTATLTLSITVEADATPSFGSSTIPAQVYTEGEAITALTLPAATGGNGTLSYSIAEALPAGLTFTPSSRQLSGTPTAVQGATNYTYTVTDGDGDTATLPLSITVGVASGVQRAVLTDTLAGIARSHLASVRMTLGRRATASAADDRSRLTVMGRTVPLGGAGASTALGQTASGWLVGLAGHGSVGADPYGLGIAGPGIIGPGAIGRGAVGPGTIGPGTIGPGIAGLSPAAGGLGGPGLGSPAAGSRQPGTAGLLGFGGGSQALWNGTELLLGLGGDEGEKSGRRRWQLWGQGDLQTFAGAPGAAGYDGSTTTVWAGVDTRLSERWLAGVGLARSSGSANWHVGGSGGHLATTLTAAHPYVRWSDGTTSIWTMAGAGWGRAVNAKSAGGVETSNLGLGLGLVEVRRALGTIGGSGAQFGLRADAAWARLETEAGAQTLNGLTAAVNQQRIGAEVSRALQLGGLSLSPFGEASLRRDGGAGQPGTGLELAFGVRAVGGSVRLDAQGRVLAVHSATGYRERGLGVSLSVGDQGGEGLSLSLSPRWGDAATGTESLWQDQVYGRYASDEARNAWGLDSRAEYGMRLRNGGRLTWFGSLSRSYGDRRLLVGGRVGFGGARRGRASGAAAPAPSRSGGDGTSDFRIRRD